jgi:AcrR family transcriptional regulator
MGASSIYRHVRCKEELLIEELADLQEEAWIRFRRGGAREESTSARVRRFLAFHHRLLAERRDLTTIALRASTHPGARVARRVLALQDRSIGLLAEILQGGRVRGDLARDVDVVEAARTLVHVATGSRLAWANGLVSSETCLDSVDRAVALLFRGIGARSSDVGARCD